MKDQVTFEVEESSNEPAIENKPSPMTEADAKTGGLSADEITAGKKHGLISDDKPAEKAGDAEEEEEADDQGKSDEAEKVEEKDPKDAAEEEIDPEDEAELVKGYNDNEKSLYWRAKKERLKRQAAQRDSEHTRIKLSAAEREINLLKKKNDTTDDAVEGDDNEESDDARVMTVGEFKKMLADQKKGQQEQNKQAEETISRLEGQEAEFKADHPDFDDVMDLAKQMMDKKPSLRKMLLLAGADPSENAAEIAYDIGRMHPDYQTGGAKKQVEKPAPKTQVDRAIKNADRRQSSAAVSAGGTKRIVSEDDLTVEDAARLSTEQYGRLQRKTRDRLMKESCA